MDKMRCLVCGSSKVGSDGLNCERCGNVALGARSEKCHITDETKLKLLVNSKELAQFGIEVQQQRALEKRIGASDAMAAISIVLQVVDSVRGGNSLRDLVAFLKKLAIPECEILALRLDEPQKILTYYRMDKKDEGSVF
jgi:hypothetical protein